MVRNTITPNGGDPGEFEPLSAQDRLFLLSETGNAHMHVGAALLLLDSGPLAKPGGGLDFEVIRRHIAARLNRIPRYRQRVSFAPLRARPHWVDDDGFDLDQHVRHLRLPHPGNESQLKRLCGQLFSQRLDRDRPLWEIFVVEGLKGGGFALIAKTHHCLVDGVGGVNLLAALLDPDAQCSRELPTPWLPRRQPTAIEVFARELSRQLDQSLGLGKQVRSWAQAPAASATMLGERLAGISEFLGTGLWPAPDCVLNRRISAQRRFEWLSLDMGEVSQVRQQFGATVNDVVMATAAGALRRFLSGRRGAPRPTNLRALVPVNMRRDTDGALGNHISAFLVSLPLGITDARRRLRTVSQRMQAVKTSKQAVGGQILAGAGVPLLAMLMRVADRLNAFNLVITNVPGPPLPLYLAGAPLRAVFPQVPLFVNQGLGIALFSYAGRLHWGLSADRDLLPDIAELKCAVLDSFDELHSLTRRARPHAKNNVLPWVPRVNAAS